MPWIKKIKPGHECKKPKNTRVFGSYKHEEGSWWQCPKCDQKWELAWNSFQGWVWYPRDYDMDGENDGHR